jgi:phosphoglycerate dehydrogenase-like enzyme
MVAGSVLLDAPNCTITPHIAGCSVEGRERC